MNSFKLCPELVIHTLSFVNNLDDFLNCAIAFAVRIHPRSMIAVQTRRLFRIHGYDLFQRFNVLDVLDIIKVIFNVLTTDGELSRTKVSKWISTTHAPPLTPRTLTFMHAYLVLKHTDTGDARVALDNFIKCRRWELCKYVLQKFDFKDPELTLQIVATHRLDLVQAMLTAGADPSNTEVLRYLTQQMRRGFDGLGAVFCCFLDFGALGDESIANAPGMAKVWAKILDKYPQSLASAISCGWRVNIDVGVFISNFVDTWNVWTLDFGWPKDGWRVVDDNIDGFTFTYTRDIRAKNYLGFIEFLCVNGFQRILSKVRAPSYGDDCSFVLHPRYIHFVRHASADALRLFLKMYPEWPRLDYFLLYIACHRDRFAIAEVLLDHSARIHPNALREAERVWAHDPKKLHVFRSKYEVLERSQKVIK
ncbi:hypothetical protein HK102_003442 [Quaeritorhiza haematococci]|nr:hypothetical protein HK102_003442 [Quaeritorhiza haematococci]